MKKYFSLSGYLLSLFLLTGCVKEMDFQKYENPQISTLYRLPLGYVQFSQSDYDSIASRSLQKIDTLIIQELTDWDFSRVEKATITFTMVNGFPFPLDSCTAYFINNKAEVTDTIHQFYIGKVSAATLKSDGTLLSSFQASKIDSFNFDQFQRLVNANWVSLHFTIPDNVQKPASSTTFFQSAYINGDLLIKIN